MRDGVPPNNVDAERAVLGAMMLGEEDGEMAIEFVAETRLSASDFYKESHQKIFRAVLALRDNGEPVDLLFVTRELERTGDLEQLGGASYLDEMIDSVPTAANAGYYASIVKELSQLRRIIQTCHKINREADQPDAAPANLLEKMQELISKNELVTSIAGSVPTAKDDWAGFFEQLCMGHESEFLGLETGFESLNKATLGLRGLSVLGGIPGQGKSSLALQLATEIARINAVPVLFYALEMGKNDLYTKTMSRLSGLDYATLTIGSQIDGRRGQGLSEDDRDRLSKATAEFMRYADKLQIVDRAVCRDISLATLRLHIQKASREHNADRVFVVIDHLQIFPCDKPGLDDMKSRLDYLVAEFKAMCEQYNATILLISEKNRQSYERQSLGAFMGSAGIEYGVDLAMLLHEEGEDQGSYKDGDRELELKIAKNRFGRRADISMIFYPNISAFFEN